KRKSVANLLILAAVLIVSLSFAGCNMIDNGVQLDDSAESRKVSKAEAEDNKPTEYTAVVVVYQDPDSVVTLPVGAGGRYRTTEETLVGAVISSTGWDALAGAGVSMSNVTNFALDSPLPDGSYPLTGTNHSDIEISLENGELMTMKANGQLEGSFPAAAEVTMNFSSTGNTIVNIQGTLTGLFVWYVAYLNPSQPPYGYFTLTGTYK
ncbi:MAG: hypothetical protein ISR78_07830, partial [Spirochaetia bacterium]|nr:hypothetical protein [Spirochaetia bacterium]